MPNDSEWQELAARGRAVDALRAYCVAHGVGLSEARTAVERWRAVNCPPSPAFQRAFRAARRFTDALLTYLAEYAAPRSFQVRILPADPKDVIGQNTRFFSDFPAGHPGLDLTVEIAMAGVSIELRQEVARRHTEAGVRLIWFVCPETRTVAIHTGGTPGTELHEKETLDGGDVLPGFLCQVAELFG